MGTGSLASAEFWDRQSSVAVTLTPMMDEGLHLFPCFAAHLSSSRGGRHQRGCLTPRWQGGMTPVPWRRAERSPSIPPSSGMTAPWPCEGSLPDPVDTYTITPRLPKWTLDHFPVCSEIAL